MRRSAILKGLALLPFALATAQADTHMRYCYVGASDHYLASLSISDEDLIGPTMVFSAKLPAHASLSVLDGAPVIESASGTFRFKGKDNTGVVITGAINADKESAAVRFEHLAPAETARGYRDITLTGAVCVANPKLFPPPASF
jgi:hypothetical protein